MTTLGTAGCNTKKAILHTGGLTNTEQRNMLKRARGVTLDFPGNRILAGGDSGMSSRRLRSRHESPRHPR
ncbi:MAG: hypothetical protein HKO57_00435 [Akkermansiaceae bacterium]|nr:hypothetical protein [Akkermansiaceae bacterium]